jgi:cysteine desulfurase/selenocysteine lyase
MDRFAIPGTVRASFGIYNTVDEIDALVKATQKAVKILS